ncbi:TlpA family protein disulfide reductase [Pseudoalteromonas sp. H105]|uniref:TlpA family protein disulfide reductase n=1 Tax=Pseudoalteromonas sp. H105 TaxID=1348393 RepID=UPI0007322C6D|nr:TlpA disulfide reductase family protein [Pseudoalteromonas sp. H105]KTF13473.1 heme-binding protein [Pseudoalteromonas sp. H105]
MKKLKSLIFNIILASVVFFAVTAYQQRNLLATDNSPAPYFNLPLLDDSEQRINVAMLGGKNTVIYFFAPWCTICRYSMPNLESALKGSSINAIGIALDYKNPQEVTNFVTDLNLTMPIVLGNNHTQSDYKISAFPTYYIVNEQLQITSRSMGYSSELGIKVRAL